MDKATLTISLPQSMKDYIGEKIRQGRFSTPSEYIRSLIRDDQDLESMGMPRAMVRRGVLGGEIPQVFAAKNGRGRK